MPSDESQLESGAKTTIQSTAEGKVVCERLQREGYFTDAQGVFRFAVCFALANNLSPEESAHGEESGKGLTWSVTGIDPNQVLRDLITLFSPGESLDTQRQQYRRIEEMGNVGLREIGRRLGEGASISELVL